MAALLPPLLVSTFTHFHRIQDMANEIIKVCSFLKKYLSQAGLGENVSFSHDKGLYTDRSFFKVTLNYSVCYLIGTC